MYGVTETRAYMVSLDGSSCFIVYFIHKKAYWFLILKRYMISLNKRKNTNNKNQHSWIYSSIVLILLPYIYVSCSMGVLVHALIIQNKFHAIENVVIFPIRIFHYKTLKKYIIRFDEMYEKCSLLIKHTHFYTFYLVLEWHFWQFEWQLASKSGFRSPGCSRYETPGISYVSIPISKCCWCHRSRPYFIGGLPSSLLSNKGNFRTLSLKQHFLILYDN